MARGVLRASKDPVVRGRALWYAVGVIINVGLIGVGSGYAFAGTASTVYPPAFRVLLHFVPFGLYGHGWIMVGLGTANLWGLAALSRRVDRTCWRLVKYSGRAILGYTSFTMFCMVGAILVNHRYQSGFWTYLVLALLAGAVVSLPPAFPGVERV